MVKSDSAASPQPTTGRVGYVGASERVTGEIDLAKLARALSREERLKILQGAPETSLHRNLKALLIRMEPNSTVEITHGSEELGKDLVMVREDLFGRTVVGIVVKTGDIRGETAGVVDQIISQVGQAFDHPAQLPTIKDPQDINTVWVVLAGRISGSARKRLGTEHKRRDLRIFDIEMLIDSFTDYYPQVFFESQVIDVLQRNLLDLETDHIFSRRAKNLSECFVEPLIQKIEASAEFDEDDLVRFVRRRRLPFSTLRSMTGQQNKIILAGDPGTGKSAALNKLAVDLLRNALTAATRTKSRKPLEIPIVISARRLMDVSDVESLLAEHVSSGPHHQDSGEAKIRESTAGVSRKPSSDCKACGCSSKHLCGLTAWNT